MGRKESDFELEDPWGRTSVAAAAKLFLRHALLAWAVRAQHSGVSGARPATWHVALGLASLAWRLFCAHGGGHRYFAHRAFETTRALELAMAVTIQVCALHDGSQSRCYASAVVVKLVCASYTICDGDAGRR